MSYPSLSVALCAYNEAKTIGRQLDAIVSQMTDDDEMVVLNDGSTDDTGDVVLDYLNQWLKYGENKTPSGVCQAFNQAAKEATKDWLYLASGNDVVQPGAFEAFRMAVVRHPFSKLIAGNIVGKTLELGDRTRFFTAHELRQRWRDGSMMFGAGAFIRRDVWNEMGGFDPKLKWHADWCLFKIVALKHGMVYLNYPVSHFTHNEESYCWGHGEEQDESFRSVWEMVQRHEMREVLENVAVFRRCKR